MPLPGEERKDIKDIRNTWIKTFDRPVIHKAVHV